ARFEPQCIVALGIAGGFKPENVAEGDLIVPSYIADLAIRKIREEEGGIVPELRPRPFETGKDVVTHLGGSRFDRNAWVTKATAEADWPDGRRPNLHFGAVTMVSSDEVVSSTEWMGTLLRAWPQLKGVEMEAGGVCAAAKEFNVPVTVIRGVSDLADPVKK